MVEFEGYEEHLVYISQSTVLAKYQTWPSPSTGRGHGVGESVVLQAAVV